MDEVVPSDVIGEKNEKVYEPLDGQSLIIPQAIRKKQIYLGRRHVQYISNRAKYQINNRFAFSKHSHKTETPSGCIASRGSLCFSIGKIGTNAK